MCKHPTNDMTGKRLSIYFGQVACVAYYDFCNWAFGSLCDKASKLFAKRVVRL
ncbi:hypothetical protein D3C78_1881710 [compost metagenome]